MSEPKVLWNLFSWYEGCYAINLFGWIGIETHCKPWRIYRHGKKFWYWPK